ncbi:MAG: hypothetical protein WAP58_01395, partial [Peptococcia bacterium]
MLLVLKTLTAFAPGSFIAVHNKDKKVTGIDHLPVTPTFDIEPQYKENSCPKVTKTRVWKSGLLSASMLLI